MFYWIYDIPTQSLAILLAGVFVVFSVVGCVLIRPILRLFVPRRSETNDVVGYVLSCFCVFYGLLLGLIAVAAYQNYNDVDGCVSREAVALTALYQDVSGYPDPHAQNLRWLLRDYCRYVIKYAWPLQQKGIVPAGGRSRVVAFHERLLAFEPQTAREEIIHAETLRQFNVFLEARRMRLHSVTTGIPAVMWYVVLIGAVINIAMVWLFDMKIITHIFLGGLLSFFLGTMIFLIAAMDNPFRGELSITPAAFEAVHKIMMEESYLKLDVNRKTVMVASSEGCEPEGRLSPGLHSRNEISEATSGILDGQTRAISISSPLLLFCGLRDSSQITFANGTCITTGDTLR